MLSPQQSRADVERFDRIVRAAVDGDAALDECARAITRNFGGRRAFQLIASLVRRASRAYRFSSAVLSWASRQPLDENIASGGVSSKTPPAYLNAIALALPVPCTMEEILNILGSKRPFYRRPRRESDRTEYLTNSGAAAYEKLLSIVCALQNMGVLDKNHPYDDELDRIVDSPEY